MNQKGIETIHDKGVYDIINGQLDRSNAYEYAEEGVRPILEANPTIEVAIDLHRDGVAEGTHLVTEVNGKPTAKIMYFNGLSRTRANGDITYLPNPYIQDNLAFSLQMELASERMFPGFARHIYLRAYRYNLHLLPKSLLIEAGAQTNTVQEMKNAMEVLAETLCQVIGFDKQEIVEIAEKIDTYETSILPFEDCCTIFVAKHPVTKPNINVIRRSEENLAEKIDELFEAAVNTVETIVVK